MVLPRPLRLGAIVVVVAGLGLSACGDDDDIASSSTTVPAVATTVASASTTVASTATTATTAPAGRVLEYTFRGGNVTGEGRVSVKLGEQVTIRVVSDVAEEIHVHTYDLTAELEPEAPGRITFTADIPGVHEVELESSHLRLLSLEVQ